MIVVMTIIAVIAGVLLPAIFKAHKQAQILGMKSNFQALISAMENYKADFRDYPKCGFAETDFNSPTQTFSAPLNTLTSPQDKYRPDPPRVDGSLAMALLGPGPAGLTLNNAGIVGKWSGYGISSTDIYTDMDGADGPGFRTRYELATYEINTTMYTGTTTLTQSPNAGATSITVAAPLPATLSANAPVPFTAISLGGPGSPDAHVPVLSWQGSTITLALPLQQGGTTIYPVGSAVSLLAPAGKTWGPYLPADKFKVGYIVGDFMPGGEATGNNPRMYMPVLLDNWGNQILYFAAYNSYANHVTGTNALSPSSIPNNLTVTNATALVGPLIGAVSGNPNAYRYNTMLDNPTAVGGGTTGPAVFWDGAANYYLSTNTIPTLNPKAVSSELSNGLYVGNLTTGQIEAILTMLGDNQWGQAADLDGPGLVPNNAINYNIKNPTLSEKLAVSAPYFFVSAGPQGNFEDMDWDRNTAVNPKANPNLSPADIMAKSSNIYSFP